MNPPVFHLQMQVTSFAWCIYRHFCLYERLKRCLFKRLKVSDSSNQWYKKWRMVFKTQPSLSFSQWHPCSLFRKHLLNTFFLLLLTALFSDKFLLSGNLLVFYFELLILMKTNEINPCSLIWWAFKMCSLLLYSCLVLPRTDTVSQAPWELWPPCPKVCSASEDCLHWFAGATGTQGKLVSWHWPAQESKVPRLSVGWQWFSVMLGTPKGLCVLLPRRAILREVVEGGQ